MTIPTNPYIAGNPVGKNSCFIGRSDVLLAVEDLLRHPVENAIVLHGQRRIGKTSILQYLATHLNGAGPYHPILFDLMYKAGAPLSRILCDLARKIALELNLPTDGMDDITEEVFRDSFIPKVIRSLPEQDSLVFLLDEFDVLADPQAEKESKRQFFGYLNELRHLDPKHLQFVFVLGRNVGDLDVIANLFFKDIRSHRITLLKRDEFQTLVSLAQQNGSLYWTTEAVACIWELTSGHPYLTQTLCSQIWDDTHHIIADGAPVVSLDLVEKAVEGALDRSQHVFSWFWEGLGPAERIVASALACEGQKILNEEQLQVILLRSGVRYIGRDLQDAPQILKKWDILAPVGDGFQFSVELLRRWIFENQPPSRTRDELDRINPIANSLYDAASACYQVGNIEDAEKHVKESLGHNPNHPHANDLYADILMGKESFEEAQVILERLDQIAPGKARHRLKKIYQVKGELALQNKDYNAAVTAFKKSGDNEGYNKAVELLDDEQKLQILAVIYSFETAGKFVEAYQLVLELIQKYPDDKNIQFRLQNLENQLAVLEKQRQLAELQQRQPTLVNYLYRKATTMDPFYENTSHYPSLLDSDNNQPNSTEKLPNID